MKFSQFFGCLRGQDAFDFVDRPVHTDIPVFIDPYLLATMTSSWGRECHHLVHSYFQRLLNLLLEGKEVSALSLMSPLKEDNRIGFGFSRGEPNGDSVGTEKAALFLKALRESPAFSSGRIPDLESASFQVPGIDRDLVSDMVAAVLRLKLAQYTVEQCEIYGIERQAHDAVKHWDGERWQTIEVQLPKALKRSILLVPRAIVRETLSLRPDGLIREFINLNVDVPSPRGLESLAEALRVPPRREDGRVDREEYIRRLLGGTTRKELASKLIGINPDLEKEYREKRRKRTSAISPMAIDLCQPPAAKGRIEEVARENRSLRRQSDSELLEASREWLGFALTALHPALQRPRPLTVNIKKMTGVVLDNNATTGLLAAARRRERKTESPNVVFLSFADTITETTMGRLDHAAAMRDNSAGLVFLVGKGMEKNIARSRPKYREQGLIVLSESELQSVAESAKSPDKAMELIDTFVTK